MNRKRKISTLNRKINRFQAKKKFILYCEGRNTEPSYFLALRRALGSILIDIETIGGVGVPSTIAREAIARTKNIRSKKKRANSFQENDVVWAVFDRDEHPCFLEAMINCNENNVPIGVSNPCFEIWLILHYEAFDKPDGRHAVQNKLEAICPTYNAKSGKSFDCDRLLERVAAAIKLANAQYSARECEGKMNPPYTTVQNLVQDMLIQAKLVKPR